MLLDIADWKLLGIKGGVLVAFGSVMDLESFDESQLRGDFLDCVVLGCSLGLVLLNTCVSLQPMEVFKLKDRRTATKDVILVVVGNVLPLFSVNFIDHARN